MGGVGGHRVGVAEGGDGDSIYRILLSTAALGIEHLALLCEPYVFEK
jgi:hypothetical protein